MKSNLCAFYVCHAVAGILGVALAGVLLVITAAHPEAQTAEKPPTFLLKWGSSGTSNGQFDWPYGIATDSSSNVYVADTDNNRVQKFDSKGNFIATWGALGSSDGRFYDPYGIATDSSGNVYVADTENSRIQKFDSRGTFLTKWVVDYPYSVATDSSNNVYVPSYDGIQKFDSNGTYITKWGSYGTGDGELEYPEGVAVDTFGNIYVVDTDNNRVQKFDSSGKFLAKWGVLGTGDGEFYDPYGIATDSSGNVYVADSGNDRIQKFGASVAAPTVSQVSPENGATGVSTSIPNVTATFSEKMDSSTLNDSTIKLRMGKKTVPVGISCDDPCQTVTLDPYPSDSSQPLAANKKFKVTLTTGAKDLAGNGLAKNYTWTFTTGST